MDALKTALQQFDRVAADASYRGLSQRAEFRDARIVARVLVQQLTTMPATPLDLPPPPAH